MAFCQNVPFVEACTVAWDFITKSFLWGIFGYAVLMVAVLIVYGSRRMAAKRVFKQLALERARARALTGAPVEVEKETTAEAISTSIALWASDESGWLRSWERRHPILSPVLELCFQVVPSMTVCVTWVVRVTLRKVSTTIIILEAAMHCSFLICLLLRWARRVDSLQVLRRVNTFVDMLSISSFLVMLLASCDWPDITASFTAGQLCASNLRGFVGPTIPAKTYFSFSFLRAVYVRSLFDVIRGVLQQLRVALDTYLAVGDNMDAADLSPAVMDQAKVPAWLPSAVDRGVSRGFTGASARELAKTYNPNFGTIPTVARSCHGRLPCLVVCCGGPSCCPRQVPVRAPHEAVLFERPPEQWQHGGPMPMARTPGQDGDKHKPTNADLRQSATRLNRALSEGRPNKHGILPCCGKMCCRNVRRLCNCGFVFLGCGPRTAPLGLNIATAEWLGRYACCGFRWLGTTGDGLAWQLVSFTMQAVAALFACGALVYIVELAGELPAVRRASEYDNWALFTLFSCDDGTLSPVSSDACSNEVFSPFVSLYWIFVTSSTVGYGDFSPSTVVSRTVTIVFLVVAVILFASAAQSFVDLLRENSRPGTGSYRPSVHGRHVVVLGAPDSPTTSQALEFLSEFYHEDHQPDNRLRTVFMFPAVSSPGLRKWLLTSPYARYAQTAREAEVKALSGEAGLPDSDTPVSNVEWRDDADQVRNELDAASEPNNIPMAAVGTVYYLDGTPTRDADLQRACIDHAEAVFVLANRTTPSPDAADASALLTTLRVQRFIARRRIADNRVRVKNTLTRAVRVLEEKLRAAGLLAGSLLRADAPADDDSSNSTPALRPDSGTSSDADDDVRLPQPSDEEMPNVPAFLSDAETCTTTGPELRLLLRQHTSLRHALAAGVPASQVVTADTITFSTAALGCIVPGFPAIMSALTGSAAATVTEGMSASSVEATLGRAQEMYSTVVPHGRGFDGLTLPEVALAVFEIASGLAPASCWGDAYDDMLAEWQGMAWSGAAGPTANQDEASVPGQSGTPSTPSSRTRTSRHTQRSSMATMYASAATPIVDTQPSVSPTESEEEQAASEAERPVSPEARTKPPTGIIRPIHVIGVELPMPSSKGALRATQRPAVMLQAVLAQRAIQRYSYSTKPPVNASKSVALGSSVIVQAGMRVFGIAEEDAVFHRLALFDLRLWRTWKQAYRASVAARTKVPSAGLPRPGGRGRADLSTVGSGATSELETGSSATDLSTSNGSASGNHKSFKGKRGLAMMKRGSLQILSTIGGATGISKPKPHAGHMQYIMSQRRGSEQPLAVSADITSSWQDSTAQLMVELRRAHMLRSMALDAPPPGLLYEGGHIAVLCMDEVQTDELSHVLLPLRRAGHAMSSRPIVILHPHGRDCLAKRELGQLLPLSRRIRHRDPFGPHPAGIYAVRGSPLQLRDVTRAGVATAAHIIILATATGMSKVSSSSSSEGVQTVGGGDNNVYFLVAMLRHAFGPRLAPVIMQFSYSTGADALRLQHDDVVTRLMPRLAVLEVDDNLDNSSVTSRSVASRHSFTRSTGTAMMLNDPWLRGALLKSPLLRGSAKQADIALRRFGTTTVFDLAPPCPALSVCGMGARGRSLWTTHATKGQLRLLALQQLMLRTPEDRQGPHNHHAHTLQEEVIAALRRQQKLREMELTSRDQEAEDGGSQVVHDLPEHAAGSVVLASGSVSLLASSYFEPHVTSMLSSLLNASGAVCQAWNGAPAPAAPRPESAGMVVSCQIPPTLQHTIIVEAKLDGMEVPATHIVLPFWGRVVDHMCERELFPLALVRHACVTAAVRELCRYESDKGTFSMKHGVESIDMPGGAALHRRFLLRMLLASTALPRGYVVIAPDADTLVLPGDSIVCMSWACNPLILACIVVQRAWRNWASRPGFLAARGAERARSSMAASTSAVDSDAPTSALSPPDSFTGIE